MRLSTTAALTFASLAAAAPASDALVLDRRQLRGGSSSGSTSDEFSKGTGCKSSIFLFARGSMEPGNMGIIIGPKLGDALKKGTSNDILIQGVPYAADVGDNAKAGGTSQEALQIATKLFTEVNTKCPKSQIIAGGYSQGAALMHGTVSKLSKTIQNQIAGVVLFGDTQNGKQRGKIANFPEAKSKGFCNDGDRLCKSGSVSSTGDSGGHTAYSPSIQPAADYLLGQLKAA